MNLKKYIGMIGFEPFMLGAVQIVLDDAIKMNDLGNGNTAPRQGEQILDNGGGPQSGLMDGFQGLVKSAVRRQIHQHQLGIAHQAT